MAPQKEKLLAVLQFPEPTEFVARLRVKHPWLEVTWVQQSYGITHWDSSTTLDEGLYKDATLLTTLSAIPKPEQAPNLKFIQLLPAGVDHILSEPIFQKEGVQIATTSGIHAPQIAEWVVMQILVAYHHFRYLDARQHEARWVAHAELLESQGLVRDMTSARVGILGYGSIGRQIARVCHSMGSEIVAFTASPRTTPESRVDHGFCLPGTGDPEGRLPVEWYHGLDKHSLQHFLKQDLDVVVVCLPLTKASHHLIGPEELSVLGQARRDGTRPGTLIINVARGQIIDQEALIASLKKPVASGGLRGAALDVTDPEPLPADSELWRLPNVVVHPHVSGLNSQHQKRFLAVLEENLARFEKGEPLVNVVEKSKGY
ncbi:D-isomer-specific 2-hydroxyacid dehydrogenase-like protein [Thozetella sp. PMI_491]|nr:D-isomer-specific 2-hydroxyacid dehydrogenase-like protein [Thozetella sp. PMI_491]